MEVFLRLSGVFTLVAILSLSSFNPNDPEPTPAEKSKEAFKKVLTVIKHPRCINCHPSDNRPHQGDDIHPHLLGVKRGAADKGMPVMTCKMCH
ncbi:MAG: hypothetical protein ACRCVT_08475, partial [Leadbetterella sp.]